MITRYGFDVFFTVTAICIILIVVAFAFVEPRGVRYGIIGVAALIFIFALIFFRDPERTTPNRNGSIVSPADGKVVAVKTVFEPEFFRSDAIQISIFMSPLNVHVNRIPVSGTVAYTRYVEGEYFAAYEDKASEKNEQMIVGIESQHGKVLMKQIAGFLARRIVCELKQGETVTVGERFGMIKFGSRVDVFVPLKTTIFVTVGTKTKAGETILGEFAVDSKEILK